VSDNPLLLGHHREIDLADWLPTIEDKSGLQWKDRANDPKSGKYVFVEKSYEPESEDENEKPGSKSKAKSEDNNGEDIKIEEPECKLEKPLESLMELIFNQQHMASTMADLNYDADKLPLGKLSKSTITRGYETLKKLAAVLDEPSLAASEYNNSLAAVSAELSNLYYSFIPHNFGRNRPPIISSIDHLKKEVQLLESLTDLKDADTILKMQKKSTGNVHPMDARYEGLKMQAMVPLDRESDEFKGLSEYLVNTRGHSHGHNYNVLDIFRIERQGEHDRFNKSKYASIPSDRRLLWHGSRSTNFGGILSQGLRIAPPEAPVTGYMFGKGVYLADMSSKSANYCYSHISGGHALLLLCEAELGAPMQELTNASYNAGEDAEKAGLHSTWGKGQTAPLAWKDAGDIHPDLAGIKIPDTTKPPGDTNVPNAYLQYNEFICYDVSQIRLRYLLRVKM
jgi:poly [ADP-ribose] polymerase